MDQINKRVFDNLSYLLVRYQVRTRYSNEHMRVLEHPGTPRKLDRHALASHTPASHSS
jgi:hypothetical protein